MLNISIVQSLSLKLRILYEHIESMKRQRGRNKSFKSEKHSNVKRQINGKKQLIKYRFFIRETKKFDLKRLTQKEN